MKTILTIVIYMQMFKQMDTMTFFYRRMHLHVPVIFSLNNKQNALASTLKRLRHIY